MARADSPNITTTSAPSRRRLLQGAAAAAVTVGISADQALAAESFSSPEFVEWQRLALKTRDWFASDEYQKAADEVYDARIDPLHRRMHELEQVIFKKPISSFADAIVLGVISLFWNDDGDSFEGKISGLQDPGDSIDNRSSGYLIRAVCLLAKATGQFPSLAVSNFADLCPVHAAGPCERLNKSTSVNLDYRK